MNFMVTRFFLGSKVSSISKDPQEVIANPPATSPASPYSAAQLRIHYSDFLAAMMASELDEHEAHFRFFFFEGLNGWI